MIPLILNPKIQCAEVSSKYKNRNCNTLAAYTIGRCDCYTTRFLMYCDLKNFTDDFEIIEATIKFKVKSKLKCNNFINAYKILTPWNYKTVTGNTPLMYDKDKIIFTAESSCDLNYSFDVTDIVKEWVKFKDYNNGLIFISNECIEDSIIIDGKSICLEIKCIFDKCDCCKCGFYEEFQRIESYDTSFFSKSYKTGDFNTITYFVQNLGLEDVYIRTQVGPDESHFTNENSVFTIKNNEMKAITTYMFSKYSRLSIESKSKVHNIVEIWFQAHY